MFVKKFLRHCLVTPIAVVVSMPVVSQEAAKEKQGSSFDESLLVTARKREESILEVPLSVTALSSDDIEKRGLIALEQLEDTSPGLTISDSSAGKTDRSVQTLTMRGFSPTGGTDTTVSMFIDGVPVSSTTALSSVGSPERIEILRGPQAAYFGRNTFAGAINVVNKTPGEELAGAVEFQFGNYGFLRARGEIESPLGDMFAFRLSGETYERDGQYDNAYTGEKLGDQSTDMLNALLTFNPNESLSMKLFGLISRDEDGPAESALLSAYDINDFTGSTVVQGQSNCNLPGLAGPTPYFCGSLPDKADPLSYNTAADDAIRAFLATPTNRVTDTDLLDGFGLGREYQHYHFIADYEIADTGLSISYLGGYNKEEWALLNDIDHFGMDNFNYGFFVERIHEDSSHELRMDYDDGGKFRGVVGLSLLEAERVTGNTTVLSFFGGPPPASVVLTTRQETKTFGMFFGATYDFNDVISVSLEGRQQKDEITPFDTADEEIVSEEFDNFLPRFIVNAQLTEQTMIYGSFSQGVNPGAFNTNVLNLTAQEQADAAALGLNLTVEPEEVDNFELGVKGTAFENKLNYAVSTYLADWTNQHNRINIALDDGSGGPNFLSGLANSGEVDLFGIEFEGSLAITESMVMDFSGAYTDSEIKDYTNSLLTSLTGISDFSGKEQPFVSKYSANLGLQYNANSDTPWFLRGDLIYKSGQWVNQANHVETEDIYRVNLRGGITFGPVDLQVYVNNLFDNDEYTSGYDYFAFAPSFAYFGNHSAIIAGLPEKRSYGVQMKYSF